VLDLGRIRSGPFATVILGDLGADVIKVEDVRAGDHSRQWGPPFQGGAAAYFLSVSRVKRGLSANVKTAEGRALIRRLAADADVLVEAFRPGTAARLRLAYPDITTVKARLIHASSGYGQTGPCAQLPGYDGIAQALRERGVVR
jgi:crotonobetainyl-CoA:carnitine CoA-transferase CaiB-like acyl-CoA transferase